MAGTKSASHIKPDAVKDRSIFFTTLPQCGSTTEVVDGTTELILGFDFEPLKQEILKIPGFPHSVPVPLSPKPYSILTIPSKGLGMIATRDLAFGELIIGERALVVMRHGVAMRPVFGMSLEQMKQAAFAELEKALEFAIARMESDPMSKKHAVAYKKLWNSHIHDGSGPLTGISRTNAFGVRLPLDRIGPGHGAVFEKLSRVNHSCSPNSIRSWSNASLSMQFYAVRDIKKGEEITTWYADPVASSSQRRPDLATYGIDCRCRACTNPSSDRNREHIGNIKGSGLPSIASWASAPSRADDLLLKPALEMLRLIEEEGIEVAPAYGTMLHRLVLIYYVLGETSEAKRYHQRWRVWQRINGKEEFSATLEACTDILKVSKAASVRPSWARADLD